MTTPLTGIITLDGTALTTLDGVWLTIGVGEAPPPPFGVGRYRFLKDHYIDGEYVFAGEIRSMGALWVPSVDVEPLDDTAVTAFYAKGPTLGGVWRTVRTDAPIYAPVTYWRQTSPGVWILTGLGAALAPKNATPQRFEDKEV